MLNSEKMIASLDQQDLEHAQKYFAKALRQDDDETLIALGEYLESIGFLPYAKKIYEQLSSSYPELHLNLAQIAAEDDDMEEAFMHLDQISKTSPFYVNALLITADLYQMEGLSDVAREKLLEAKELGDEPIVILGLAEIEMDLGHFKEAIDYYAQLDNRQILELADISTYQRIGRAYASIGKFETAIEFLEKAIEIEYDDDTTYELATILVDQEEYQKANLYFQQIEAMNPDFEGYEYVYAKSLHEEHKTQEALRLLQQAIRRNEYDSQLLLLAAQYSYELHDIEKAEGYLKDAKNVAEDIEDVLLPLTNLYLHLERYEDIIDLDQDDISNVLTRWNIAKAYQELDMEDESFEVYQSLERDLKDNPEFLHDYAYILREFAEYAKAKEMAENYLKIVPDNIEMQEFLEFLS